MKRLIWVPLFFLCGCGAGLSETQVAEYESLGAEQEKMRAEMNAVQGQLSADFNRLGRLEAKKGAVSRGARVCGFKLKGKALGPLPFRSKPGYVVQFRDSKTVDISGRKCRGYALKVKR